MHQTPKKQRSHIWTREMIMVVIIYLAMVAAVVLLWKKYVERVDTLQRMLDANKVAAPAATPMPGHKAKMRSPSAQTNHLARAPDGHHTSAIPAPPNP